MKVLILGGYGVFGGRLASLLSDLPDLELLICGRSMARAADFCTRARGRARMTPIALERRDVSTTLDSWAPDVLVDASGPFQDYGDARYAVVLACINSGVHYLDFADAADFVFGITQFDAEAKAANVFVLSGVSSFPVLTAAVLREMARDGMQIVSVRGGIAPSPFAGVGLNVIRAVAGYAGGPVRLWRDGAPAVAYGLTETLRYTVAVPGKVPLRNLLFSLVDVPDLQVIPPEHTTMRDIWMGAAPVPEILHRMLTWLARMRASAGLAPLTPLAPLFHRAVNLMQFGEHRGGMFVHATGQRGGLPAERSWHLLAEGNDGPLIPSMGIEALLRRYRAGIAPAAGARAATRELELGDYDAMFAGRNIFTGFRDGDDPPAPLYRRVLGTAFDSLSNKMRAFHGLVKPRTWDGIAQIHRGNHPVARLIAYLIGFPEPSPAAPVSVTVTPVDGIERWTRTFGTKTFSSVQSMGTARDAHLVVERFGPMAFSLALIVEGDRLILRPRRWTFFGLPMPRALLPQDDSHETEIDGRFHFDVRISAPVIGLIVAYRGWLAQRT